MRQWLPMETPAPITTPLPTVVAAPILCPRSNNSGSVDGRRGRRTTQQHRRPGKGQPWLGNAQNRLAAARDPNLLGHQNRSRRRRERGREGDFFFGEDQASGPRRRYARNPGDDRVRQAAIYLRPEAYSQLTQRDGRRQVV